MLQRSTRYPFQIISSVSPYRSASLRVMDRRNCNLTSPRSQFLFCLFPFLRAEMKDGLMDSVAKAELTVFFFFFCWVQCLFCVYAAFPLAFRMHLIWESIFCSFYYFFSSSLIICPIHYSHVQLPCMYITIAMCFLGWL